MIISLSTRFGSIFDPAKSFRVLRIVQSDEHSHLLFVAPALMFRPMQTARQIKVHVLRTAYLQETRLIEDIGIIVRAGAAIGNIKVRLPPGLTQTVKTLFAVG